MKKLFLIGLVLVLGTTILPLQSQAAGASLWLSPVSKTVVPGQTFTMVVPVVPSGATIYTAKADIRFPANLLEVRGFTFSSGWLALSQPGYDTVDNASGALIKSAGLPGGLTASKVLGTITFRAKAIGTATVSGGSGTLLLDKNSANAYTGANQSGVTVRKAAVSSATPVSGISGAVVSASPSVTVSGSPVGDDENGSSDTQAFLFGLSGQSWIIIILAVGVLLLLWFLSRSRSRKENTLPPTDET